jgi:hypothetical protein
MATKHSKPENSMPPRKQFRPSPTPQHRSAGRAARSSSGGWTPGIGIAIAGVLALAAGTWWASACNTSKPAARDKGRVTRVEPLPTGVQPMVSTITSAGIDDEAPAEIVDAGVPDGPYEGPYVVARVITAPVYSTMSRSSDKLIGYMRSGGKAPTEATPIVRPNCKEGWYRLIPRGFVCGRHVSPATPDAIASSGTPPDFDALVPYKYAYNTKDGTPLYREIPTREQMEQYEPYLVASRTKSDGNATTHAAKERSPAAHDGGSPEAPWDGADAGRAHGDALDAGLAAAPVDGSADEPEPDLPWWQLAPDAGRKPITLEDMKEGADGILVKRMARGFFVAVDKTFRRNDRLWIRTTEGLYAPSDRMSINSPPAFHGVEITNGLELPVAFVLSDLANTYELEGEDWKKRKERVKRYTPLALTGRTQRGGGELYRETREGYWVRDRNVTVVDAMAPPAGAGDHEKWIDVNLSHQTLTAYEGARAVYATLVSSGKKGSTKATDHSTVEGEFRVREKHVAATMDGDGAAPGEGPYSIQDVPYVMYFKGSYAIHGAFWHNNFGRKMSHGCVNLAPADAKWVFQWSEPQLPPGWHGAWATDDHPGTRIVLHQ